MKTKFNNSELCHVWAQQSQNNGKGSNMFFEGTAIYSYGYHFKIAEFITLENGVRLVLFNPSKYSISTSKHKSYVSRAISHEKVFECVEGNFRNWDYNKEMKRRVNSITETINKAAKSRVNGEWLTRQAVSEIYSLREFATIFNIIIPEIVSTWDVDNLISPESIERIKEIEKKSMEAKKLKQQKEVDEWLRFERNSIKVDDIYLRTFEDKVETSLGATVSMNEAKVLYSYIKSNRPVHGFKIGYYTVHGFDGKVLQIGCHKMKINEIDRFAHSAGWDGK